jgi:ribosomal protein S18 acetylase RimI-like enzyme
MTSLQVALASSTLDLEQARDLRRSVLCGELNWPREVVEDPADLESMVLLACLGPKPVGSARLIRRDGQYHIECLAVLERFRRQGIGRALLSFAEAKAQSCVVALVTGTDIAFFERCGYSFVSESESLVRLEKCAL